MLAPHRSRPLRFALLIVVIVGTTVSCGFGGGCESVPLASIVPVAGEQATSCVTAVTFDGVDYHPGCQVPVKTEFLGPVLGQGRDVNFEYKARAIRSVPVRDAIAVSMRGSTGAYDVGDDEYFCGRWWFAANEDLPDASFRELTRRVTDQDLVRAHRRGNRDTLHDA